MAEFKSQLLLVYSTKLGTTTLYFLDKKNKQSYSISLYLTILQNAVKFIISMVEN